ncbi:asparaginase [Deinococcus metallilatus]|uniref:Asparaginase n=1 Tax=Deinococcus metallilatus TaxID=1211322 RepID=A0AAJ5F501_9DEIO|nr:asparaginase [Deinococcus metallilatus]MBB5295560.1 L-asparaginase II [Deinococcus metallilatus]QBY07928.1 asparaginase [Deinococcus metallilatus]RXJ12821.1 asparaginase [Deinococcus metallilatus]TLK27257.1 asparaginase [Deinococcus metallilatus]GMA16239.1 asparaginase [Deinococcus metallilatus]
MTGQRETGQAGRVIFMRGGLPESIHMVHVAVVDGGGQQVASCGDADLVTFPRSSSKPVQALPLALAAPELPGDELAIACASHAGTPEHLAVVERLLARSGSTAADLRCGTHPPFDPAAAADLIRHNEAPTPLHHNCSGKHAGMLLACVLNGWPREGYTEHAHPLQVCIRELHAELGSVTLNHVHAGTDGCSVPAFALPLHGMARLFARLAAPSGPLAPALERVFQAMTTHPFLVAGPGRLDTTLMPLVPGLAAKMGAEAFYGMALRETPHGPLGIAFKVQDGGERARPHVALAVLGALGLPVTEETRALAPATLHNWAGREVGTVEVEVPLKWA